MTDPNLWLLSFGKRKPHVPLNEFNTNIKKYLDEGVKDLDKLFWKLYHNYELPMDNVDSVMSRGHFKKYYKEVFVGAGEMKK